MPSIEGSDDGNLSAVLEILREVIFTEMRVALPGTIVKYDVNTRQAEVLPLIMRRAWDAENALPLPSIPNVPIMHPQTQAGALLLPVAKGDPVTLIFSDRSLDDWKASAGLSPVEAVDQRKHELSDCWAFPGGWPSATPYVPANSSALALQVTPGTPVYIGNGTEELLTLVDEVLDFFINTVNFSNAGGPTGPPTNASVLEALQVRLNTLKA